MLGYKISFDLVEFWYDDATGKSDFVGYCSYEETGDNKKYEKNRHNIGFLILDHMLNYLKDSKKNCSSNAYNFEFNDEKKFLGAVCEVKIDGEKFLHVSKR